MARPLLALACGDPCGVGPEVAVEAMRSRSVRSRARLMAVGPRSVFEGAGWRPSLAPLLDPGIPFEARGKRGPSSRGGEVSYGAVRLCLELALRGLADGFVTAPSSKQSWALARTPHRDHTQMLGELTRSRRVGMWLEGGGLRTVLVTRHISLSCVPRRARGRALRDAAVLARSALLSLGVRRPRIGVCALNPHAGDDGLIGTEERRLARELRALRGLGLEGPFPADAAWAAHAHGRFDCLLSLYHDQALIPLKLAAGFSAVNWTLGVPVVRTSPGHGTAFDIAGKGRADASGMIAAALLAARIAAASRTRARARL